MHRQGRSPKGFGLFVLMGRANKDLGRLADQLKAIMEKWDA